MHVVDGPGGRETSRDIQEAQRMTVEQVAVVPELYRVPCEPLVVLGCPPMRSGMPRGLTMST